VLILLVSHLLCGQNQQKVLPKWKVGDEVEVIEKGQATATVFGMSLPMEINSSYKLKVKSKDATGYWIEGSDFNLLSFTGGDLLGPMLETILGDMQETLEKGSALKLRIKIDPTGKVKDLENWAEVKSLMTEVITEMSFGMAKKYSIPQQKIDSLLKIHLQTIDTKEKVMQQTLESIEFIMSGYNVPYLAKGSVNTPAIMYSKMNYFELNKKGLPATLKTKIESANASKTKLYYDVVYGRTELAKYLKESAGILNNTKESELVGKLNVIENRTFEFDNISTWPTKIKTNATLRLDDMIDIKLSSEYSLIKKK
jgi:hypothetical protein